MPGKGRWYFRYFSIFLQQSDAARGQGWEGCCQPQHLGGGRRPLLLCNPVTLIFKVRMCDQGVP